MHTLSFSNRKERKKRNSYELNAVKEKGKKKKEIGEEKGEDARGNARPLTTHLHETQRKETTKGIPETSRGGYAKKEVREDGNHG